MAVDPVNPLSERTDGSRLVLLINDTSNLCHWGCFGTSEAIKAEVLGRGNDISTVSAEQIPRFGRDLNTYREFDSDSVFSQFATRHHALLEAVSSADHILVNGEGSLHGDRNVAKTLLYIIYISAVRYGKRVDIINHSCYPTDFADPTDSPRILDLYKKSYAVANAVVVREPVSYEQVKSLLRSDAHLGFDCLPLYLDRYFSGAADRHPVTTGGQPSVVFSGSVRWTRSQARTIYQAAKTLTKNRISSMLLIGSKSTPSNEDARLASALETVLRRRRLFGMESAKSPTISTFEARTFAAWMGCISQSTLLVSGRFHHTIAAACAGTPFVVGDTNTPKIQGLMLSIGSDAIRADFGEAGWQTMVVEQALKAKPSSTVDSPFDRSAIQRLSNAATLNFIGLNERI